MRSAPRTNTANCTESSIPYLSSILQKKRVKASREPVQEKNQSSLILTQKCDTVGEILLV